MDKPNDGQDQPPQRISRADYTRKVRAAAEEQRHKTLLKLQHYEPQIHDQIQRLFADYEAPFYARLRGIGRAQTLALAGSTVLRLAAGMDRALSDTETQALMENILSSVHSQIAWKWVMTGLAGYLTYRGRRTMRFPLFTPVVTGGRFNPATGGPQVRIMWHTARFAAYYGAFWLAGEPVFQGFNFLRQSTALRRDPRVAALFRAEKMNAGGGVDAVQDASGGGQGPYGDDWKSEASQQQQDYSHQADDSYQSTSQAVRAQTQQAWTSYRRQSEASRQPATPGWDAPTDKVDDASPAAPSARLHNGSSSSSSSSSSYGGGSAWDRIRQQSHNAPGQQDTAQGQTSWGAAPDSNDEASPRYHGDKDSYSFATTTDGEEATARRQAQREFDELVERERRGADQERGSWGRR